MLTIAAPSSGTEAERAAHRLFTDWDTGVGVLGAVAAFRPYEDPKSKRRQSDVVVLVPDGVIVVRLVGSQRQSGSIVAHPSGAWSIGGEALRIAGGGSNPLPALRTAQAAVVATLRASGLEPGQVAMLIAVGAGEPVEPADGRLDEGVVVCPISDEGLAIGLRRAAALAAAGDVRQWTTADVKAALSAFGATGRMPAVEELNSEGFMYSPYVLRRPDLVAAATAVAAASPSHAPNSDDGGEGAPTQVADPPEPDGPDGPDGQNDGRGDDADPPDEGLGAFFGGDIEPARPRPTRPAPPARTRTPRPRRAASRPGRRTGGPVEAERAARWRSPRILAAALLALLLVAALGYAGFTLIGSDEPGNGSGGGEVPPAAQTSAPVGPAVQQLGERSFQLAVSRAGERCTGNAYGQVADYFVSTDCTSLDRELYTSDIDGVDVVVAVARVTMPDESSAEELKVLADTDGTGNVDDLLRAGERIPNGPAELNGSAYASNLDGEVLTIIVAAWLDPGSPGDEQDLEQLATQALGLEPPV